MANTVLFIFETKSAQKILLKLLPKGSTDPWFSAKFLVQSVHKLKLSIPNNGKVSEVTRYDDFRVFIWTFMYPMLRYQKA